MRYMFIGWIGKIGGVGNTIVYTFDGKVVITVTNVPSATVYAAVTVCR